MHRFALATALAFLYGCGSDSGGNGSTDGGGSGSGHVDAGPEADAPPLIGDKYSLRWGPVTVPSGREDTQCIWLRLGNETEIKVHQLHNVLSSASHHLIVYKDDMDTTEQTTPMHCNPFEGALNTTGMIFPMMISQKIDDQVDLPSGVAYTLAPHQMVKLEMHYINTTDNDETADATAEFYAADPASIHDEANILFMGSIDIDLQPGETKQTHAYLKIPSSIDLSASNIFAITGHTHKLGTDVTVNVAPSSAGPMTSVYAPVPFQWGEPKTVVHDPAFSVPAGGGFDFTCSYRNTTDAEVKFGESANDEMCFFWAYYYPSQGSRVCIHTDHVPMYNIPLDVCCPGDSLCSLVHF